MTAGTVTIFGGSGFVGRHLVQRLGAEGWRVRVAVRRPHEEPQLRTMGDVGQIQIVQANVRDVPSVEAAAKGADVVINLVGLLAQGGKQKFRTIHAEGAGNVARAAKAAGAKRLIHMSAIGADSESESAYARTKASGEKEVRAAFPEATIMRPSVIFGPDDGFISKFANLVRITPVVPLVGFGRTRFQPVHINDVVDAFMAALGNDETCGETYELGGPEVFKIADLQKEIARQQDRARLFVPVPFWYAKFVAYFLQLPWTILRIPALLTVDQVELLKNDNVVAEDAKGFGDLGIENLMPLGAVLPDLLVRFRKHGQFDERSGAARKA